MHLPIVKVKNVRWPVCRCGPPQVRAQRELLSNSRDGGGARQHREGGLAAEARRAHPQLARPLLHPVRQRRPGGLQDAARAQQLPRPAQQVHGARLPDHGRGQAALLRVHHPRPAVDHRHRAQLRRGHRGGAVSHIHSKTWTMLRPAYEASMLEEQSPVFVYLHLVSTLI